jgi:hypothetical protein
MKDKKNLHHLLEDLRDIGHLGPLSRFGQDLNNVEEVTNKKCRKGTRMFYDPETGVKYSSTASGYVRRYTPTKWHGIDITSKTVLNPTRGEKYVWGSGRISTRRKIILLLEELDRLQLVARGVRNYRKTKKK